MSLSCFLICHINSIYSQSQHSGSNFNATQYFSLKKFLLLINKCASPNILLHVPLPKYLFRKTLKICLKQKNKIRILVFVITNKKNRYHEIQNLKKKSKFLKIIISILRIFL